MGRNRAMSDGSSSQQPRRVGGVKRMKQRFMFLSTAVFRTCDDGGSSSVSGRIDSRAKAKEARLFNVLISPRQLVVHVESGESSSPIEVHVELRDRRVGILAHVDRIRIARQVVSLRVEVTNAHNVRSGYQAVDLHGV